MRKNKKISTRILRQLLIGIIMFSMISTGYINLVKIVSSGGGGEDCAVTVRVYGDNKDSCTPYPNEAFNAYWEDSKHPEYAHDFVYQSGEDPFDPGILAKDSVTFNPAYINMTYKGTDLLANGGDSSEKVALRLFYQPGYTHPMDWVMYDCSGHQDLQTVGPFDGVVLETTYSLVTSQNDPIAGKPWITQFVLPYTFTNPNTPGMDTAGVVQLTKVDTPATSDKTTDGEIRVEKYYDNVAPGTSINFMDHTFTFINYNEEQNSFKVNVTYAGNMYYESNDWKPAWLPLGDTYTFDRSNFYEDGLCDPCHRWFLRINSYHNGNINCEVGRVLAAGETFYVNGVRYDMPAIYVELTGEDYAFKYITFQTPMPKCDTQMWFSNPDDNLADESHVTSQWLANLLPNTAAWVLPPFNEMHLMMDDIGLQKINTACHWESPDWEVPQKGLLFISEKEPLIFSYVSEDIEARFNTSLAQVLSGDVDKKSDPITQTLSINNYDEWTWASVYTKPNQYTEFALPDQETPGELYANEPWNPDWYTLNADGNEYLLTSSFIAPNSFCNINYDRYQTSKDDYCYHEIWDRTSDLFPDGQGPSSWYHDYYGLPRVVFQYDATTNVDLYINQEDNGPTVRVYGEPGYIYPTESWSLDSPCWYTFTHDSNLYGGWQDFYNDFIYPCPVMSFLPGAIPKDSVTFNPAWLSRYYHGTGMFVNGVDASEKVFLRMFYEPDYSHCIDGLMDYYGDATLYKLDPFNAVVLETTYMVTDTDVNPDILARPPLDGHSGSNFMLPCYNNDPNTPGMDAADVVNLYDVQTGPDFTYNGCEVFTDGQIAVEKLFQDVTSGQTINFMDHTFTFGYYEEELNTVQATITYQGNQNGVHNQPVTQSLDFDGTNYYFNRNNLPNWPDHTVTDPAYRWYARIVHAADGTIDVALGRVLSAGETFYVDGVRYDMPAVYVAKDGDVPGGFKYITFQTPLPKGDANVPDWSHVSSQWLANLLPNTAAWVLPPFNEMHTMRDDIGLIKVDNGDHHSDWEVPLKGLVINGQKDPLQIKYVAETSEPRFNTSIAERFNSHEDGWDWWSVYTLPKNYTEFLLPNQEITSDTYTIPDEYKDWYPTTYADGSEYLVTSSWYAPNSNDQQLFKTSKHTPEVHDVFDFLATILTWDTCKLIPPRVAFAYDAEDNTGLYINPNTETPPGEQPPTAEANGPYTSTNGIVTFDATLSSDPDPFQYRWDVNNDGTYEIDWTWSTTTLKVPYTYSADYHGMAILQVMDDEGDTATDVASVDVTIAGSNLVGDFSGDGHFNINDAHYLAMYLLGANGYPTTHGCNPDVNCQNGANIADARYLAKFLLGSPPGYEVLYPLGCSPWE